MFKRAEYKLIKSRLEEPRKYIQVLMGPRQVGKTTLVKQVLEAIKIPWQFYSADNVSTTSNSWISNIWEATRILKDSSCAQTYILVIDEIQKISNWSEAVKKEWDADTWNKTDIRVLLLGSSRVMLIRELSESLAGRFEEIRMEHWSYKEMKECFGFSLEQYIFFGGYPGAAPLINEYDRFRDYIISSIIETTINKDILIDTPIGKPALLRQTFELGAAYSGKILSLTKMLGSLQDAGNTVTLTGYLNLLSESGLLTALQKFSMDLARRRASIPKFQVWDNSIRNVDSRSFGDSLELVYDAPADSMSVSFPRISPDGNFMAVTLHGYGNFSIWHKDADIRLLDLRSGRMLDEAGMNSKDVESYHSWSGNSRWLIFSSRRMDGLYTRPYITHIDADGHASKPFLLPQKDPMKYYGSLMFSYNIPEFISGKIKASRHSIVSCMRKEKGKEIEYFDSH